MLLLKVIAGARSQRVDRVVALVVRLAHLLVDREAGPVHAGLGAASVLDHVREVQRGTLHHAQRRRDAVDHKVGRRARRSRSIVTLKAPDAVLMLPAASAAVAVKLWAPSGSAALV